MKRVAKPEGRFNLVLEEVPLPEPGPHEVRVRAVRSLISRGSELWRRYVRPEAIDPQIMGYSLAGVVDAVGPQVARFAPGDRVAVVAPHAQYVVRDARVPSPPGGPSVTLLPAELDFDAAPFWPLVTSAVIWTDAEEIQTEHSVVILGQGLVGSLMLQVARSGARGRLIALDTLPPRLAIATAIGADDVVDAGEGDPVAAVMQLTDGQGADVVVYAVGGSRGPEAFAQAQRMVAPGGLLHVVGLYEDAPLPLDSRAIQRRRLLGGAPPHANRSESAKRAVDLLASGQIATERMITHHFPYTQAADAFRLLYQRPDQTLGVELDWDTAEA